MFFKLNNNCSTNKEVKPNEMYDCLPLTDAATKIKHMCSAKSKQFPQRINLCNRNYLNPAYKSHGITLVIICNTILCLISLFIKLITFVLKIVHDNNMIDNIQYYYVIFLECHHVISVIESSANFFICLVCSRQFRYTCFSAL